MHSAPSGRPAASVTGPDRRTLDAIFSNPLPHDVAWMDVIHLVGAVGSAAEGSNNAFVFQIGEVTHAMHKPHTQHLTAPEILGLRRFFTEARQNGRS